MSRKGSLFHQRLVSICRYKQYFHISLGTGVNYRKDKSLRPNIRILYTRRKKKDAGWPKRGERTDWGEQEGAVSRFTFNLVIYVFSVSETTSFRLHVTSLSPHASKPSLPSQKAKTHACGGSRHLLFSEISKCGNKIPFSTAAEFQMALI